MGSNGNPLRRIARNVRRFANRFSFLFKGLTRSRDTQARQYLVGLLQTERSNMERMEETVPDADEQSLQHFVSNSTWDARAVMNQVAADADGVRGGHDDTVLVIDDSGIPRKGTNSVGVSRQYCGQTGKVHNCQVGVYASLVRGDKATLIDARLFLPERWTSDTERCDKAGVPAEERRFRTRHEIALEIVQNALETGVRFSYIAFDGFYGENGQHGLAMALVLASLGFVALRRLS